MLSRPSSCTGAWRTGSPRFEAARRGRDDAVRRGHAGRAERTIELLKEYDVFAVPVDRAEDARYAAVLVAIGSLSRGFRLPDAGLQIYAETGCLRGRAARAASAGGRRRRRFSPTCAT